MSSALDPPKHGSCLDCGAWYEARAFDYRPGTEPSYHRHCPTCGDAGPYQPSPEMLAEWREAALDAQVCLARRHDPLLGDRRVVSLAPVPDGQGIYPEAHRAAAESPHLLEVFTTEGWTVAGVADNENRAVAWAVEPNLSPDRVT